jgi:hypothetical protein
MNNQYTYYNNIIYNNSFFELVLVSNFIEFVNICKYVPVTIVLQIIINNISRIIKKKDKLSIRRITLHCCKIGILYY